MPFTRLAMALWAVAASSGAAFAQDTTRAATLDPITVTAVRTRAAAPPVVTVTVEGDRIREIQSSSPWDLVRRLTGIEIHEQGQGPGFASDAVLRGFTSDHSSDVLFVMDGVPINLPVHGHTEGYSDWHVLIAPAAAEMRVINGPSSPRYGDFAFGGVVETVTDAAADGTTAAFHGSSWGDAGGWLRTGTRGPRGGTMLALDGLRNEGWRDHSRFWRGNALLRGVHRFGRAQVDGGLALYAAEWDSPGFLSVDQYNAGDLRAGGDPTDGGHGGRAIAHAHLVTPLSARAGLHVTAWGQAMRSRIYLNLPHDGVLEQTEERDRRIAVGGRTELVFDAVGGDATVGVEGRHDMTVYDLDDTEARVRRSTAAAYDADYLAGAVYTRWRRLIGSNLALDLGARLDAVRYGSTDRNAGTPRATGDAVFVSPKLGARYLLSPNVVVLGSLSRGFRGAPGVIEEPGRDPMTARAAELGVQVSAGPLRAHVAAFRLDVSNERIQDPVTREISDAGASVRQGLTADLEVAIGPRVSAFFSGTWNDASISEAIEPSPLVIALSLVGDSQPALPRPEFHIEPLEPGDPVPGVSRFLGRVGLDARIGTIQTRGSWRFAGAFTPIGESDVRTQPYGVLDLTAIVPLTAVMSANAELVNVFDTRYPEVRASGFLNPGLPRTLRVALRVGAMPISPQH